jgi:hypothetical protein
MENPIERRNTWLVQHAMRSTNFFDGVPRSLLPQTIFYD